ncbi:MAG: hypothetical protein H6R10_3763 [Rhodocyclaceae bacterium]|nr:hypothetical protein [Rhodocyclaceae bacterium]
MQIKQLQVVFEILQDRLLLRVSTTTQEEVRVFITRRFLRELWPALTRMLFGHLAAQATEGGGKSGATFEQPYQNENPTLPLGSAPLLPAEAFMEPAGEGLCKLTIRELKERSFTLDLNAQLLHALCSMLRATSQTAGWDLNLDYGTPAAASGPTLSAKNLLH